MSAVRDLARLVIGDPRADRVVPPTGFTAWLTIVASAAMALLCQARTWGDRMEGVMAAIAVKGPKVRAYMCQA